MRNEESNVRGRVAPPTCRGGYPYIMSNPFCGLLKKLLLPTLMLLLGFAALPRSSSAQAHAAPQAPGNADHLPMPRREFRAAWVATVVNIDWPSRPGLDEADLRRELIRLLDTAVETGLNAVVLQVRPACDAIYPSELEPWSEFLSGRQGTPPASGFDPLAFAVKQAHRRGLQLHAWFNPYRARHSAGDSELADNHVTSRMPEAVVEYGDQLWLDPGNRRAEDHSLAVILDVVRRYDVDGVHFDDYFYPYPVAVKDESGKATDEKVPFPDDASWTQYQQSTPAAQRMSRDDWRRENVNRLVRRVSQGVHDLKPHVLFGISPFGICRPGKPAGVVGFDQYDRLYADALRWLQEGWVDYLSPQLYWPIRSDGQSFPILLDWWSRQNDQQRHLWPGLYTSRLFLKGDNHWQTREIIEQVRLTQAMAGSTGEIHFSMKALVRNSGEIVDALRDGPYAEAAVIPESPWLAGGTAPPRTPKAERDDLTVTMQGDSSPPWQWLIQVKTQGEWSTHVLPGRKTSHRLPKAESPGVVVVRAVDRLGRFSEPVLLNP